MTGRVVFIGAGPGTADLITVRGAERLAQADVVLFDALTDPALRRHAPRATWIDVGKRGYTESAQQASIDALLVRCAHRHANVVRLKGGDPSVFGRLEEELRALAAAGIACEVVPGVTAALAAAADALRPLTRRGTGRSASLSTAVPQGGGLLGGRRADTEVFYMAGRKLGALSRALIAAGWRGDTPVCVVSRAGWPDAVVSDHALVGLAAASVLHAGRPTVVTVGAGAVVIAGSSTARPAVAAADSDARAISEPAAGAEPARPGMSARAP